MEVERARAREVVTRVALVLSRLYEEGGRSEHAVSAARWAIAFAPLEEGPRSRMIGLLGRYGDLVAASREYREYQELLKFRQREAACAC